MPLSGLWCGVQGQAPLLGVLRLASSPRASVLSSRKWVCVTMLFGGQHPWPLGPAHL